jgi:hypothetical protein
MLHYFSWRPVCPFYDETPSTVFLAARHTSRALWCPLFTHKTKRHSYWTRATRKSSAREKQQFSASFIARTEVRWHYKWLDKRRTQAYDNSGYTFSKCVISLLKESEATLITFKLIRILFISLHPVEVLIYDRTTFNSSVCMQRISCVLQYHFTTCFGWIQPSSGFPELNMSTNVKTTIKPTY